MEASNIPNDVLPEENQSSAGEGDRYQIETIDEGKKFQLTFHVPPTCHGRIVGAQGITRKRLQEETNTTIVVPLRRALDTNVVIEGTKREEVLAAKNKIDLIVNAAKSKQRFTHFLSIPFTNDETKTNFLKFKDDVLRDTETADVDFLTILFQKPEKLHLTIFMLQLLDDKDSDRAIESLEECKKMIVERFLQDAPIQVSMTGVFSLNDNPSACRVLSGNIISEKLKELTNEVAKYFASRGLGKLERDSINLHVTLMNTKFADRNRKKQEESGDNRKVSWSRRRTFDATRIIENFKDYYFGTFTVHKIHLSQLQAKAPNGYYESTSFVTF